MGSFHAEKVSFVTTHTFGLRSKNDAHILSINSGSKRPMSPSESAIVDRTDSSLSFAPSISDCSISSMFRPVFCTAMWGAFGDSLDEKSDMSAESTWAGKTVWASFSSSAPGSCVCVCVGALLVRNFDSSVPLHPTTVLTPPLLVDSLIDHVRACKMLTQSFLGRLIARHNPLPSRRPGPLLHKSSFSYTRFVHTKPTTTLINHYLAPPTPHRHALERTVIPAISPAPCTSILSPFNTSSCFTRTYSSQSNQYIVTIPSVMPFAVPQIEVHVSAPIIPRLDIFPLEERILEVTSTLRKRKTKMNNHKRRKRLKKQRFLLRKLGKI